MRISAVASVQVLSLVLFAHSAICQRELPAIGNRSTNTDGRVSLRVEAPQGKAIVFEASNVLRQSPHQKLRTLEGSMNHGYLHLEGNVVIKMDCYLPTEGALAVCTVIRADSAQYNEVTGEIEATGRVHITLERTLPEAAR